MELFIINYGLGGGFGGGNNYEVVKTANIESANEWAFESACQDYDNYAGMYGLRDLEQIMEEENCEEQEAWIIYEEERESWLEYDAVPYSKEAEDKAMSHHYHNPYFKITDNM